MAGIIEVHEKMLAQLQQRNQQLQQEKAEVELKLRQATALLSELQSLWMDLPPQVAASISKVLSEQNKRGDSAPPQRRSTGNSNVDSLKGSLPTSAPLNSKSKREDAGLPSTDSSIPRAGWFSFSMNDMFGCTATPRDPSKINQAHQPQGIQLEEGSTSPPQPEKSPPQPEKRPPPQSPAPTAKRAENTDVSNGNTRTPGRVTEIHTLDTDSSPEEGTDTSQSPVNRHIDAEPGQQKVSSSPVPVIQMVHIEDQCFGGYNESTEAHAENMVELLAEVPGATPLIAEIDVLCCALQKQAAHAHRQLEQRIENLKSESREHRQRIEEAYLKTTAAQHEEVELCKAKVAELIAEIMPSNHMGKGLDLTLCDDEWARCERIWEQRARVGQAHADWLEVYFAQRLSATEASRDAIKIDFAEDLEAIWQRKAVLMARFRARLFGVCGDEAKNEGKAQEIVSLRKDLQSLEKNAVMPLKTLADMSVKAEKEEIARLKTAVTDAKAQCKTAAGQFTSFLEECKVDAEEMKGGQNAELFAHAHLRQRVLLIVVFRAWVEEFFRMRIELRQREFSEKTLEVSACEAKFQELQEKHSRLQCQLNSTVASRSSTVEFICLCMSQTAPVSIAFSVWVLEWCESRLSSAKEDLSLRSEEAAGLKVKLSASESARVHCEKQYKRAQNFCDADMLWIQKSKNRHQGVLIAVFSHWNLKRLETQLSTVVSELDHKKAECMDSGRRIEPLSLAVDFAQRRASRRAMLAAVFCCWATRYLHHIASRAQRRESDLKRRTDEKLGLLRDQVVRLVDEYQEEEGKDSPRKRANNSLSIRTRYSQMSAASSICGESDIFSNDELE
jgi:hypothetical protein